MGKAINQNDIIKVIEGTTKQTKAFGSCIAAVKDLINSTNDIKPESIKKSAVVFNDFDTIMSAINNAIDCITNKNLHKISKQRINRITKTITLFNEMLEEVAGLMSKSNTINENVIKSYQNQIITLGRILDVLIMIAKLQLPNPLTFKLKFYVIRYLIGYINSQIIDLVNYLEQQLGPKNLKIIGAAIKTINASNNYVAGMVKTLEAITAIKIPALFLIKFKFKRIKSIIDYIYTSIQEMVASIQQYDGMLAGIDYETKVFRGIYEFLLAFAKVIDVMKFANVWLVLTIKLRLAAIAYVIFCVITALINISSALIAMQPISIAIANAMFFWNSAIYSTVQLLQNVKTLLSGKLLLWFFILGGLRLKMLRRALRYSVRVLYSIMALQPVISMVNPSFMAAQVFKLAIVFIAVKYMLNAIKKASPPLLFGFFARRLIKAMRTARRVIRSVMKLINYTFRLSIARMNMARRRLNRAIRFVIKFIMLIQALIILALAMAFFIIASPIIILGLLALLIVSGALVLALKALVFIFKFIKVKDLVTIGLVVLMLALIVGMFLLLAVMLMLIAQINEEIVWMDVFEFLLMVIVLMVIFLALGALLVFVGKFLIVAAVAIIACVLMVVIIVGCILVLAFFLWLLTKIKIDREAVKESVENVVGTALDVMISIFDAVIPENKEGKSESWWESIIGMAGEGVKMVLKAILSVIFLAFTMIAIGIILFIALELRLLQELALDKNAIKTNVQIVIDTALMVVDMIFGGGEEKEDDDAGKPWYKAVFEWVGGTIFKLIGAILSVYFLAYSMIAITLVLFIATELRILMEINLNKEAIRDRVSTVINTAIMVQELIFGGGEKKEDDNANKPWYQCVFEWIGGTVMRLVSALLAVYFLAMSVVAIGLVLFIAAELKTLQDMGLQHELIKESVTTCIDTAIFVSNIFDRRDEKPDDPSTKGFIPSLIEFFTPGPMVAIMDAIMAVGFLAISLVAISLVLGIAANLKLIENLNLNASAVTSGVTTCIDTALFVINKVFSKDTHKEEKSGGVIESLLEFTMGKGMTNIIKALVAVGFLACAQAAIGMIGKIARDLNDLHKLPNLSGVQNKVSAVIRSGQAVINTIFAGGSEANEDALKAERYLHSISRMMPLLRKLAPQMVQLSNYTNKLRGVSNTQQIRNTLSLYLWYIRELNNTFGNRLGDFMFLARGVNAIVGNSAKLSAAAIKVDPNTLQSVLTSHINFLRDVSNLVIRHDLAKNIQTVIQEVYKLTTAKFDDKKIEVTLKNYSDFLKVVDSVDIENLKTAARMVEKMADFSQSINGNFEHLAETLNEKIAPLIEDLKEAIDNVSAKVEASSAKISASVHESGRSDLSEKELREQVERENPNATQKEKDDLVAKRLKGQLESNSKKGDIEEIINLLKTGVKVKKP